MSMEAYKRLISNLGNTSIGFKPHRLIALLSAIEIVFANFSHKNIIFYDEVYKSSFTNLFNKFSSGLDSNRPHTPFFHLQSSGLWNLHYKQGKNRLITVGSPKDIIENIEFAKFDEDFYTFLSNQINREQIIAFILLLLSSKDKNSVEELPIANVGNEKNPFVVYLNTMQSVRGNNTGALAEFQAQSENFSLIEEEHPLTVRICEELLHGRHVILTGHAGDGKSTIALEVYRKLSKLPSDAKLSLSPIMDVAGTNISIVKDLSEHKDTSNLFTKLLAIDRAFLLVSNTGSLLKLFKENVGNKIETEANLLKEFNRENGNFICQEREFSIYNLAKLNNLPLAKRVFQKMLDAKNWEHCRSCSCQNYCVILQNRDAIVANDGRCIDRIFLIYKRLLAYGRRLTMRQLMEHLAWTLTGGQDKCDIEKEEPASSSKVHNKSFFHLFWGNNGLDALEDASQMQAIQALRNAPFGSHLSPEFERTLWTLSKSLPPLQMAPLWEKYAVELRKANLSIGSPSETAKCRSTLRRILYFLADGTDFDRNIDQYLNSAYTRRWQNWQTEGQISPLEKSRLRDKVFAVLYEQFSGHQSEDVQESKTLYLTQHRNAVGLRQSVQLLTAQIRIDDEFDTLQWKKRHSFIGFEDRFSLCLPSRRDETLSLDLDIAFLDYVERRYQGELESSLSAAYTQRLETFKTALAARNSQKGEITLVRTLADKNTSSYSCILSNGKLVVRK